MPPSWTSLLRKSLAFVFSPSRVHSLLLPLRLSGLDYLSRFAFEHNRDVSPLYYLVWSYSGDEFYLFSRTASFDQSGYNSLPGQFNLPTDKTPGIIDKCMPYSLRRGLF